MPKHLVDVGGETLIARTVRLLVDNGVDDVVIVGPDDPRYLDPRARRYVPAHREDRYHDADKFLNSRSLWNRRGRTLVVYGDVYFTDRAMRTVVGEASRAWLLFARPHGSWRTGSWWPECFVQSFFPEHLDEHHAALMEVVRAADRGEIDRCGGWEHYRAMCGAHGPALREPSYQRSRMRVIDDRTEDFDYPSDYRRWRRRRSWPAPVAAIQYYALVRPVTLAWNVAGRLRRLLSRTTTRTGRRLPPPRRRPRQSDDPGPSTT